MKLPNPYTQRELADARKVPPQNEPFAAINFSFHETYTRLVEQVLAQLGHSVPVIVLIGDDATLLCDGQEWREQVIPARYHELKALGHLAFGAQLMLMANGSGSLTDVIAKELHDVVRRLHKCFNHGECLRSVFWLEWAQLGCAHQPTATRQSRELTLELFPQPDVHRFGQQLRNVAAQRGDLFGQRRRHE